MPETATEFKPWIDDAEAIALLASCAANPPLGKWNRVIYALTADEWFTFTGTRADKLEVVRNAYGQRALDHAHATDDYTAINEWCVSPTVGEAIRAAISAPKLAVAA